MLQARAEIILANKTIFVNVHQMSYALQFLQRSCFLHLLFEKISKFSNRYAVRSRCSNAFQKALTRQLVRFYEELNLCDDGLERIVILVPKASDAVNES